MQSLTMLYQQHLTVLQQRTREVLARFQLDALLIHSGELRDVFLDDHPYPFKVNPQFKAWLPVTQVPNCWLWVDGVSRPRLWFYLPDDYWNPVQPLPDNFWSNQFTLTTLTQPQDIDALLPNQRQYVAYIGPHAERARQLAITDKNINPQGVIDYLHYYRAYKTDYELFCMREAQKIAVDGHFAAQQAFMAGQSEFAINLAYLTATRQRDGDVPYSNIVALNEHACVLHYTEQDRQQPEKSRSFLLDAGSDYHGYAADITRSYSMHVDNDYAVLLRHINEQQQELIATMRAGIRYTEYHVQFNQRLAKVLLEHDIMRDISDEALVQSNITSTFMPHGVGHPLGLQVHDVAGFMQDDSGSHLSPPPHYPALRCTRMLEPRMVLTIEPGIYFIDSLLAHWRSKKESKHFNWKKIAELIPFGGVRIEDNVVIHENNVENMTRALNLP